MATSLPSLGAKATASILRGILRQQFPATKFSVVTERGSTVSAVRVSWTDGPTVDLVKGITARFEAGHFDGMTDSYDYAPANERTLLIDGKAYVAGTRYIFEERKISPALANRCIAQIAKYWGGVEVMPIAVAGYFGFTLEPQDMGRKPVRPDLGQNEEWHSAIHRAAENATEYTW